MSSSNQSMNDLYKSYNSAPTNSADAAKMKQIEDVKDESIEHALWASAQSLALAKVKVFHTMAKSVNDQQ